MPATSIYGPALPVEGLILTAGTGSPEVNTQIANVSEVSLPVMANTIDVTNVGDLWKRHIPTLLDMGKISLKIWWEPQDATHNAATGLRYLMINKLISTFVLFYPNAGADFDSFPAYVVEFAITGKVGGAFEASITLANSGAPTLC